MYMYRYTPGSAVRDACWDGDDLVVACADGVRRVTGDLVVACADGVRRVTGGRPRVVGLPADLVACSRRGCLATALDDAVTVGGQTRVFAAMVRQIVWEPAGRTLAVLADGVHLWEAGADPQLSPRPLRDTSSIRRIAWADELYMSGPGVYAFRDGKKVSLTPHEGVNSLTAHGSQFAYAKSGNVVSELGCRPLVSRIFQNGQLKLDMRDCDGEYVSGLALAGKYLARAIGHANMCCGQMGTHEMRVASWPPAPDLTDVSEPRARFLAERMARAEADENYTESERSAGNLEDWFDDNGGTVAEESFHIEDGEWLAVCAGHIESNSLQWNANETKLLWRTKSSVYMIADCRPL